jgi:hypothetical protein
MTEQMASVDQRGSALVVASWSKTTAGFWIANGWFRILEVGVREDELGSIALSAFDQSSEGAPLPDRHKVPLPPGAKALKVRSYKQYSMGTKSAQLLRVSGSVTVTPMKNQGAKKGLSRFKDQKFVLIGPPRTTR